MDKRRKTLIANLRRQTTLFRPEDLPANHPQHPNNLQKLVSIRHHANLLTSLNRFDSMIDLMAPAPTDEKAPTAKSSPLSKSS